MGWGAGCRRLFNSTMQRTALRWIKPDGWVALRGDRSGACQEPSRAVSSRLARKQSALALLPLCPARTQSFVAEISHQADFRILRGCTSSSGPQSILSCLITGIESGGPMWMGRLAAFAAVTAVIARLAFSDRARALPSFARQTGQPCGTCHTDFPALTP